MLNSGVWADRNKAGFVLEVLSRRREQKLLRRLRAQASESLIEMARWRESGHAYSARLLLGRMAGIEEDRLQRLVQAGEADEIIRAVRFGVNKGFDSARALLRDEESFLDLILG